MRRALIAAMSLAWLAAIAQPGHAQYKWQSSDGGIVYSDLPPPSDARLVTHRQGRAIVSLDHEAEADLPFAVKTAKAKHPVTLYATPDCAPCKSGRELLAERGIPFTEKSIGTAADIGAYKALGFGEAVLPGIGVGRERMGGFEPGAWNTLLDAAGYPKRSALPSSYRQADARPLAPTTQKVEVVVREDRADGTTPRAEVKPANSTAAIERYRQAMQDAAAAQRRAQQPDIRF